MGHPNERPQIRNRFRPVPDDGGGVADQRIHKSESSSHVVAATLKNRSMQVYHFQQAAGVAMRVGAAPIR